MQFSGFPRGTLYTPVPNPLFGPLLEQIQDLAELKVTLRGLWLLHRLREWPRMLPLAAFLNDRTLLRGLGSPGRDPRQEIRRGLRLAVERQTFLLYQPDAASPEKRFFLLNSESDRRALERLRQGESFPANGPSEAAEGLVAQPEKDRPSIFALYEDIVGTISPRMAEELKEAEDLYPWQWVWDAFKIAEDGNKRSWRYIAGILRRWAAEGREPRDQGKDHGEPGRHPKKDYPEKYLEEYQRRRGRLPWEPASR